MTRFVAKGDGRSMSFGIAYVGLRDDSGNEGEAGEAVGGQIWRNALNPR